MIHFLPYVTRLTRHLLRPLKQTFNADNNTRRFHRKQKAKKAEQNRKKRQRRRRKNKLPEKDVYKVLTRYVVKKLENVRKVLYTTYRQNGKLRRSWTSWRLGGMSYLRASRSRKSTGQYASRLNSPLSPRYVATFPGFGLTNGPCWYHHTMVSRQMDPQRA